MKTPTHLVTATMLVASILLAACASPATGGSDTTTAPSSSASTSSLANVVSGVKNFLLPIAGVSKGASPSAGPASGVATASGASQASNGQVGVPAAAPGVSTKEWPANEGCRIVPTYTSTLDVDTVYARAMRAYTFRSIEQEQIRSQVDRLQWTETNYMHESHPGSYYHLRQSVSFRLEPQDRHSVWMELEIVKNGAGSDVTVKYCYTTRDASAGTVAFHAALQRRFRSELG